MYRTALTRSYAHHHASMRVARSPLTWMPPPAVWLCTFGLVGGAVSTVVGEEAFLTTLFVSLTTAFQVSDRVGSEIALIETHKASSQQWMNLAMRARGRDGAVGLDDDFDKCMKLVPPSVDDLEYGEKMARSML